MKKIILPILLILFSITLIQLDSVHSFAGWKQWTWPTYKVKFNLPSDWRVSENHSKKFFAHNTSRSLSIWIGPWFGKRNDGADKVASRAFYGFNQVSNKRILEKGWVNLSSDFEKGYIIYGTGKQNGRWLYFGILGLVHPNSNANLFVRFAWWSNPRTNSVNTRLVTSIAKSFAPY